MKKNLLAAIISVTIATSATVLATAAEITPTNNSNQTQNTQEKTEGGYLNLIGTINKINEVSGTTYINVEFEDSNVIVYKIFEDTILLSTETLDKIPVSDLKENQKVFVAYPENTPSTRSIPPQITPTVVVAMDAENIMSLKVGKFDEDNLSIDKSLKLNISDETVITNFEGEVISKEHVANKNLIIFYSIATASLPPQTPPIKIFVLEDKESETLPETPKVEDTIEETEQTADTEIIPEVPIKNDDSEKPNVDEILASLSEDSIIEKEGVKYIALYKIAEKLGYTSSWNNTDKIATIHKDLTSYTIKIGEKDFNSNHSLTYFNNVPFVQNNRTYVEIDFLNLIIGN